MAWDAELIQITTQAKINGYYIYTHRSRLGPGLTLTFSKYPNLLKIGI